MDGRRQFNSVAINERTLYIVCNTNVSHAITSRSQVCISCFLGDSRTRCTATYRGSKHGLGLFVK